MKYLSRLNLLVLVFFVTFIFFRQADAATISNIRTSPDLDNSYFGAYQFLADIAGYSNTDPVYIDISGANGDGGSCWIFRINGVTCFSATTSALMTYISGNTWGLSGVRPDAIYPQITFDQTSVFTSNVPSIVSIKRDKYHMIHYNNPFTMVGDLNFWLELDVEPLSLTSSVDLQVYLVNENHNANFFRSDWRNSSNVELVDTITKNIPLSHSHGSNSAHHLITLSTNSDGTIGTKHLDVSNDFWIILYANTPDTSTGWNLMFQPASKCAGLNYWYSGDQTGWQTNLQTGCPDSHVHITRKGANADGVNVKVTAGADSLSSSLSFAPLPNLPPSGSSIINPVVGGAYSGNLYISFATSTDINNDPLRYDLYLKNSNGSKILPPLLSSSTATYHTLDTTGLANGDYGLVGYVNDGVNVVEFGLNGNFTVNNTDPIQSLTAVSLLSSNIDGTLAEAGDTITLSFTSSGAITTPTVSFYSGGEYVDQTVTVSNTSGNNWTATYVVEPSDTNGGVSFNIHSENLNANYYLTTNNSYVNVYASNPVTPQFDPAGGTYESAQSIYISLPDNIYARYTLDGSIPTCSTGILYSESIPVLESSTIKIVACDPAGNSSPVGTAEYVISDSYQSNNSRNRTYGISIPRRVQYLYSIDDIAAADELKKQWPQYFSVNMYGATSTKQTSTFMRDLYLGLTGEDVRKLQIFLNSKHFLVATKGPGSPGNETDRFGMLTRNALIRYQIANNIYPAIGYFGPVTRAQIDSI